MGTDLTHVASAMKNALNFDNQYPILTPGDVLDATTRRPALSSVAAVSC